MFYPWTNNLLLCQPHTEICSVLKKRELDFGWHVQMILFQLPNFQENIPHTVHATARCRFQLKITAASHLSLLLFPVCQYELPKMQRGENATKCPRTHKDDHSYAALGSQTLQWSLERQSQSRQLRIPERLNRLIASDMTDVAYHWCHTEPSSSSYGLFRFTH